MWLFLVSEVMLFAGLVGSYIVLRLGARSWKPPGFQALELGLPLTNTGVLVLSSLFMFLAGRAVRRDDTAALRAHLAITLLAGIAFVVLQGFEFQRLRDLKLPLSSVFGSVFYTLVAIHAVHVAGGVLGLGAVLAAALRGKYHRRRSTGVDLCGLYWHFVVIVWAFIFTVFYVLD
jgi:heme/copper-type cytochrome/quinol oxidase subunit 3